MHDLVEESERTQCTYYIHLEAEVAKKRKEKKNILFFLLILFRSKNNSLSLSFFLSLFFLPHFLTMEQQQQQQQLRHSSHSSLILFLWLKRSLLNLCIHTFVSMQYTGIHVFGVYISSMEACNNSKRGNNGARRKYFCIAIIYTRTLRTYATV